MSGSPAQRKISVTFGIAVALFLAIGVFSCIPLAGSLLQSESASAQHLLASTPEAEGVGMNPGALVAEMIDEERRLLAARQASRPANNAIALYAIAAAALSGLCVAAAGFLLSRRYFANAHVAERELLRAYSTLEERVGERTCDLQAASERLKNGCTELRTLVTQAPLAIAMLDRQMRYLVSSERWISDFGRGCRVLNGQSHYDVHPDIPEHWRELHRRALAGECLQNQEELWVQADGTRHWLNWAISPWRDSGGEIGGIIIMAEDVTPRKQAEERLRLAHAVFQNMQEALAIIDLEGRVIAVNPAFRRVTEYSEAEIVGQSTRVLRSGREYQPYYDRIWECVRATGAWQGEMWSRRKGGEVYPHWLGISLVRDDNGEAKCYVSVSADISRMEHASSHLQYLAHHDALTGLPNRSLLSIRLRHSLERARRDNGLCAVLFLDLDGFKAVNDRWGHEAGDELLRQVSGRFRSRLRDIDTLARLGGDEFVLVVEQLGSRAQASKIAQSIVNRLRPTFDLGSGRQAAVGVSIGIGLYPTDGLDGEGLMRRADAALYAAKAAGRSTFRFASEELSVHPGQARERGRCS